MLAWQAIVMGPNGYPVILLTCIVKHKAFQSLEGVSFVRYLRQSSVATVTQSKRAEITATYHQFTKKLVKPQQLQTTLDDTLKISSSPSYPTVFQLKVH